MTRVTLVLSTLCPINCAPDHARELSMPSEIGESEIREAVENAGRGEKTGVFLLAGRRSSDAGQQEVKVHVGKLPENSRSGGAEVWLAVTESNLESDVKSGENAGKNLRHASVLRSLRKLGAATTGSNPSFATTVQVKLKPFRKRDNLRIVAFLQEKKTLRILGAGYAFVSD